MLASGQRRELQNRFGDHRQRALGTDQQTGQVVADHALGGQAAGADRLAGTGHSTQTQRVLARRAVLQCPRTRSIAGQVAADGAVVR